MLGNYLLEKKYNKDFFFQGHKQGVGFRTQMNVENSAQWATGSKEKATMQSKQRHLAIENSSLTLLSFPPQLVSSVSSKINKQLENEHFFFFFQVTRGKHRRRKGTVVLEKYTVPSAAKALRHKRKTNRKPQNAKSFILPTSLEVSSRRLRSVLLCLQHNFMFL